MIRSVFGLFAHSLNYSTTFPKVFKYTLGQKLQGVVLKINHNDKSN
nr:MAG TPA: hypothetical protein [Crassvirales sp.]